MSFHPDAVHRSAGGCRISNGFPVMEFRVSGEKRGQVCPYGTRMGRWGRRETGPKVQKTEDPTSGTSGEIDTDSDIGLQLK